MPLFGSHRDPSPEVYVPERNVDTKKHGLFHRRDDTVRDVVPVETTERKHGLFHRHDRSPTATTTTLGSHRPVSTSSSGSSLNHRHSLSHSRRGLLHRAMGRHEDVDPSILQARERVMDAEEAEEQADRALEQARLRVREAREHMKRVEREAEEEARRAKIKQQHAKEVTKRAKGLGRHGI